MHTFGSIENYANFKLSEKKDPDLNTIERFYIHAEA